MNDIEQRYEELLHLRQRVLEAEQVALQRAFTALHHARAVREQRSKMALAQWLLKGAS
jgi:hypothetical protein